MSSLFNQASLVVEPAVYENGKVYATKPFDGTGDLTFSRASNATRVQSDGLIEKVRTNLILQSNTLNTTWTNPNVSVTGGQTDPDGGLTAWLITETTDGGSLRQAVTATGSLTFSFTLKANTGSTSATLFCTDASQQASFDLSAGTFSESGATGKMVSLGNGWWRCSISFTASGASTLILFPSSGLAVGSTFAYEAQLETGDIATDYIATTTAAVSVGPVSGLPRLDYLNSTCPRLLLEPQRTNLAPYSEQLSQWSLTNATLTSNDAISPDGYQNADKIVTTSAGCDVKYANVSVSASTTYTASFWVKLTSGSGLQGRFYDNTNSTNIEYYTYDSQLTIGEWSRVTRTFTTPAGCTNIQVWYLANSSTSSVTAHFWGFQLEAGAYATSYIPTLGTSVTRVADACYKTSASALIGQTEGTLFIEVDFAGGLKAKPIRHVYNVSDGTDDNRVVIYIVDNSTQINLYLQTPSVQIIQGASFANVTKAKIAFAYKSGQTVMYVNGTLAASSTDAFSFAATLSKVVIGARHNIENELDDRVSQALLFKTRLTNDQLAELTA
jgi:hypothetical protein